MDEKDIETTLNKIQSTLQNTDTPTLVDKFINWLVESGIRLIVGIIIISIGFKLIKKIIDKLDKYLEKKDVEITLRRFLRSFTIGGLKSLLVILVATLLWNVQLTGLVALFASRKFI